MISTIISRLWGSQPAVSVNDTASLLLHADSLEAMGLLQTIEVKENEVVVIHKDGIFGGQRLRSAGRAG